MNEIKISDAKLDELKMLADWQLRELGIEPASVNAAVAARDERKRAASVAAYRRGFAAWSSQPGNPYHEADANNAAFARGQRDGREAHERQIEEIDAEDRAARLRGSW